MRYDKEKACSGLIPNSAGGHHCRHGHATTAACFGNGYPHGVVIPVCVREDKRFDEALQAVTIAPYMGT
jgi:hypothetical protein